MSLLCRLFKIWNPLNIKDLFLYNFSFSMVLNIHKYAHFREDEKYRRMLKKPLTHFSDITL